MAQNSINLIELIEKTEEKEALQYLYTITCDLVKDLYKMN